MLLFVLSVLLAVCVIAISVLLYKFRQEATLRKRDNNWLVSILDAVPFPISVTNANREWTFVNKAVEEFLNVKRKDLIGKKCSNWDASICNTENCGITRLENGYSETFFKQFDSSFKVFVEYLRDMQGKIEGHVEIVRDITEIIEMAEKNSKMEHANRAKSDFLARVSHEIRTPLNSILGITEIQLQKEDLQEDTKDALDHLYDSGYLLLNVINDILDLSKIEAGKLELVPVMYNVAAMLSDTARLNVINHGSKPVKFTIQADENLPAVLFGDELRIRQIVNNVLSNAFKYTDSGEVVLSIWHKKPEQKEQDADKSAEQKTILEFCVTDTGQGMTSEQVKSMFDGYTSFNLEANRATGGTGLGISITKYLVQMMRGEIQVQSEPGKGSVFTVRIPQGLVDSGILGKKAAEDLNQFYLERPEKVRKAPQIAREYMPYGRVLIVDDVKSNLYVARGLMMPYGLSVETAENGIQAIEKIKAGCSYDVIFMDHFMPQMDGIEATAIIRELGYKGCIIALTANALAGQAEMFLEKGFDSFISKPIDLRQLNASLNKYVRDKHSSQEIQRARQLR